MRTASSTTLLVTSATYRQSSKVPAQLYAADQFNRLLARGPRFRVEAETIQDIALSVRLAQRMLTHVDAALE